MTTQQRFEILLTKCGMFDSQASAVMEIAKSRISDLAPGYNITWDGPANEYPDAFYALGFNFAIKPAAIEWIEQNVPNAWYKPMFQ